MRIGRIAESRWLPLALLALLATLAYGPLLGIPLLEDDYPNLWQSLQLGSPVQVVALLGNPVFRLRATSFWAMFALWQAGGVTPVVYHLASLLLHIANTWLLYGVCRAWPRMAAAAFWAAAFFAVQEGHQEAVLWFSAINELLLFFFGMGALWCWLRLEERGRGLGAQVAGLALFALALLSKESAVVLLALFPLTAGGRGEWRQWRRRALRWIPYALLAGVAVASIAASRGTSFRFSDGSFELGAPFWNTWPRNCFRVLWIWGLPAGAAVFLAGDRAVRRAGLVALAWIGIGLVPYSFLTYSTQIPSRQTYLASAGLALLFGLALAQWRERPRAVAAVAVLVLVHNTGYLWTKKRHQFLERAAPTEQLIAAARRTPGPLWVRCFPRNRFIVEEAVHLGAGYAPGNLIWDEAEAVRRRATPFCYLEGAAGK